MKKGSCQEDRDLVLVNVVVAFVHDSFSRFLNFSCVILAMSFSDKPQQEKSLDL